MLTVIVTGDRYQAARAMACARIPFAFVSEMRDHSDVQTIGRVCPVFLTQVKELSDKYEPARDAQRARPIGSIRLWSDK